MESTNTEAVNQQQEENKQNETAETPVNETNTAAVEEKVVEEKKEPTAEEKINELNDKYLRLYSEFDNYRKRTAKERLELIKSAGEDVFKSFLPVMDDFERAQKSMETSTDITALKEGVQLIYNKFNNILTQRGLEPMKSIGEVFNTDLHEAITQIPAPTEEQKGKVIDEVEKGYLLNGKVIRFAKVVIGS